MQPRLQPAVATSHLSVHSVHSVHSVYITQCAHRPDICHFSPHRKFLDKFFSTQKCVNYNKTDFATKCVNFDKTDFSRKQHKFCIYMVTISTLHTCQMWRISVLSTSVMRRHLKFIQFFYFPAIVIHGKLKILHIAIFSPQI